jgi:hypothetical protein
MAYLHSQFARWPSLEPHPAGAARAAVLPQFLPGEDAEGGMSRANHQFLRAWPRGEDFQRQSDAFQLDPWYQAFLADTHDLRLDAIARRSGFHAPTADHEREVIYALGVAGAQLAHKEYDPATERRLHDAFARYSEAAEAYNPHREPLLRALAIHRSTPPALRGDMWHAIEAQLRSNAL